MNVTAIADRLFASVESQNLDEFEGSFTDDAVIWHNFDDKEQSIADVRALFERMTESLSDWHYAVAARHEIPGGFVQQHVLTGKLSSGGIFKLPACVVVHIRGDKISRIDEYFDPAAMTDV